MKFNIIVVVILISKCFSVFKCGENRFKRNVDISMVNSLGTGRMNHKNCNSEHSKILEKFQRSGGHRTIDVMSKDEYCQYESHQGQAKRCYGQNNRYQQKKLDIEDYYYESHHQRKVKTYYGQNNRYQQMRPHKTCPSAELKAKKMPKSEENPRIVSLMNNEDYDQSHEAKNKYFQTKKQKEEVLSKQKGHELETSHSRVIDSMSAESAFQNEHNSRRNKINNTDLHSPEITTDKSFLTTVKLQQFDNKEQLFAHFSLRFLSDEIHGPRTARTTTVRVTFPFQHDNQSTTLFYYLDSEEQMESISTTSKIGCLPYVSGEDLFEYYLRNISQGQTTEDTITRKRIRFSRTTTTERDLGLYDSVTSAPGYFDDSLKRLVDSYVGSRVTNSSEVMRIRARDAQLLKEAEEREARGESAPSSGFDKSLW